MPYIVRRELKRSLNPRNLTISALASLALGIPALIFLSTSLWLVPFLFVLIAGIHCLMHLYFGWRFERGIKAAESGNDALAIRLLAGADTSLKHYDPDGICRATLQRFRTAGD
jgi:hypothetical protein